MTFAKPGTLSDHAQAARPEVARHLRSRLQGVRSLVSQLQTSLEAFERDRLDPLLDRALSRWGDRRGQQHQTLAKELGPYTETAMQTRRPLTINERQIHRGLYISSASLGLAVIGSLFFPPLRLLSLPGLIYGSLHSYRAAYNALVRERRLNMNVLTALVNTVYIGGGFMVLGNLTTTSYFFSLKLLDVVKDRFEQGLLLALTQRPQPVWVLVDGQEVRSWLEMLKVGDTVVVRAGELIPVDGIVGDGLATVDQHVLTGEARPVEKGAGDPVFAATIVLTGTLYVLVEQTGAETTVAKISQILAQTVDFRTTRQLHAQRLTDQLVAPTLGLAALTLPFLGLISAAAVVDAHPHREINNLGSLTVLNFLVLATQQGILVKDGRSLELLKQVDTLVFDKTGTLTQEQPHLAAIHCCADYTTEQVLTYAAAAEQRQSHPIARAILAEAQTRQLVLPPLDYSTYKAGYGLSVTVDGRNVAVGSARYMAMEAIAIPPAIRQVQEAGHCQGHTMVMVAINGQLAGAIELQAALRPEAKAVIAALRQLPQIHSIMIVSGDQPAPTQRLAKELGVATYFAEVLPTGKADLIANLQQEGRQVCYIGDGINDAIALKAANVSISMRGATTAATDTAHIVLMDESLNQLLPLFDLVQRFDTTTRNTIWAILTPGAVGLVGIYLFGFGLVQMTILDQIGLAIGTSIAMIPRLRARQSSVNSHQSIVISQ